MPGMRYRESGRDCPCCSQWAPTRASEERDWRRTEWAQTEDIEVIPCAPDCECRWGIDVYDRTTVVQDWAAATRGMGTRVYL